MTDSTVLWRSKPSQARNASEYFACTVLVIMALRGNELVALLPLAFAVWRYLDARATEYALTRTSLLIHSGIFRKCSDEVPLHKVVGLQLRQPWTFKLFGIGTVLLIVDEEAEYQPCIQGIASPKTVLHKLKRLAAETGASFTMYGEAWM